MSGLISDFASWLWQAFLDAVQWVLEFLLEFAAGLVEAIPIPEWAQQGQALVDLIPCSIGYFFEGFRLVEGMAIIGSAMLIAFFIRRLPVVG